jgi:hypothetical protein
MVEEYIKKEYEGDKDFLISVSGDKIKKKIASGEIIFPNNHKLDSILSINILEKTESRVLVRATISAYDSKGYLSNYYELITLEKNDDRWVFVDIERDQ